MSSNQLFIPSRLKVGFQNRQDTYSKRLAYVIYYDAKGVLRKENSWNSWRDENIEAVEIDNTPHSGFILNKSVQRWGWSYYSSGRSMIRVYDDRAGGIEFEVTPSNLLFMLMNADCHKREFSGEFVYAWDGTELVLLPVDTEEYRASTSFTELQGGKIGAKDLVPGCIYKTKKDENYVYLGKYPWFQYTWKKGYFSEKEYIFIREESLEKSEKDICFYDFKGLSSFSQKVTDQPVERYAELVEILSRSHKVSKPSRIVGKPIENLLVENYSYIGYLESEEGVWKQHRLNKHKIDAYELYSDHRVFMENGKIKEEDIPYRNYGYGYYLQNTKLYSKEELALMNFQDFYVDFENGALIKYRNIRY